MKIEYLFNQFNKINEKLEGEILEMSVKQHQVTISLKESLLSFNDVDILNDIYSFQNYVTTKNDIIFITFPDISQDTIEEKSDLYIFMSVITQMANDICSCPSLEFVISKEYIKCFLDKPGIRTSDLLKYEEILGAKDKGELELHPQRPYLLFINDNLEV